MGVLFAPHGLPGALRGAERKFMDPSRLLPYIVPQEYVKSQPVTPDGLTRHLGHDVYAMLVQDLDGVCRNVTPDEVEGTPQQAYDVALKNLIRLVQSGEIAMTLVPGPRDLPIVVAQGHWTAAACILMPRIFELASQNLQSEDLLACVPSRASFVAFRLVDEGYTRDVRAFIRKAERNERKLVSTSLFRLRTTGVESYGPPPPTPRPDSFLRRWFGA
jgi:hypothetical protein